MKKNRRTTIGSPQVILEYNPKVELGIETLTLNDLRQKDSSKSLRFVQRLEFLFFILYTKGQGEHMVDFVHHPVSAGSLVVVQAGGIHQFLLNESLQGQILVVNPTFILPENLNYIKPIISNFTWPCCSQMNENSIQEMLQICQLLQTDEKRKGDLTLREALARQRFYTWLLTIHLAWDVDNQFAELSFDKPLMSDFLTLLEKHYTEHWTVKDYAKKLGYAERTLTRTCQEQQNKSAKMIIDQRMCLEIKRHLAHSKDTITAISWRLNFEDASRMVQFFKRVEGVTPNVFRESLPKISRKS